MNEPMLFAGLVLLLAHLAVLGLSLKLYTEILKERAQQNRADKPRPKCACDGFPRTPCPVHGRDG